MTDQPNHRRISAEPPAGPLAGFRLNLEQQRKRAKDLKRGVQAGDAEAVYRFRRLHPRGTPIAAGDVVPLSEAQLVIARELGLPSWPSLKAHIEAMERARARMAEAGSVLDAEAPTLHIRCGSDLRPTLAGGGFAGDFLEYSDPLCQGPVVGTDDWQQRRATFVAQHYGPGVGRSAEDIAAGLAQAEAGLRAAADRYERVVLWFEHDSYDQLILARCLARFAQRAPRRLELISVDHFPGSLRFIGLGQLPPEALRLLWETRRPVSAQQLAGGRAVWAALRAPDPSALVALTHRARGALSASSGLHDHPSVIGGPRIRLRPPEDRLRPPTTAGNGALRKAVCTRPRSGHDTGQACNPPEALIAPQSHSGLSNLPHLAAAIRRHCMELPWTRDGLSLTQRLVLQMLAKAPQRIGQLFHDLMHEHEPLPWQSDLLFRDIIEAMRQADEPVFTGVADEPEGPWWRERLTLTATGRAVLAEGLDWLSLHPPERWVGGVAIRPNQPSWRWDEEGNRAILS